MREFPTTAAAVTSAGAVGSILGDERVVATVRPNRATQGVDPDVWRT